MSKDGTGGSLGVLDEEPESTADSSSEDHSVATDDNVEWQDVIEKFVLENTGRIS